MYLFRINLNKSTRGSSERMRAFPTATAMADGTPGIPKNARKNECIYPEYG